MKPLITDAPKHLFLQTKLLNLLPAEVKDIVKPYVSRSAYYAHPENLLVAMLDDEDKSVRKVAVKVILNIRNGSPTTSTRPVRTFRTPTLVYEANSYHEMINWQNETLSEPPLTYSLSNEEIKEIEEEP